MKINQYKLDDVGINFVEASKNKTLFQAGKLDTIIIHYTAGRSAESSIKTLTDPNVKASAHIVIAKDGRITQLVPFNIVAWHAGESQYGNRVGFNQYSIGIEIDNAGLLEKRGDKYYTWFGAAFDLKDVVFAVHRNQKVANYWHSYTEQQIEKTEELCRALIKEYGLKYILGHEEISPIRKVDPGPAFPLDKMRDRIFGSSRDQDTAESTKGKLGVVSTDLLNIREEASVEAKIVTKPLTKGQKVKILGAKNGWLKVSTEITGWVSEKYIN